MPLYASNDGFLTWIYSRWIDSQQAVDVRMGFSPGMSGFDELTYSWGACSQQKPNCTSGLDSKSRAFSCIWDTKDSSI